MRCTETGGRRRNGGKEHWDGTYQRCRGPEKRAGALNSRSVVAHKAENTVHRDRGTESRNRKVQWPEKQRHRARKAENAVYRNRRKAQKWRQRALGWNLPALPWTREEGWGSELAIGRVGGDGERRCSKVELSAQGSELRPKERTKRKTRCTETEAQRAEIGKHSSQRREAQSTQSGKHGVQRQRHREQKSESTVARKTEAQSAQSGKCGVQKQAEGAKVEAKSSGMELTSTAVDQRRGLGLRTRDWSRGRGWGEALQQGGAVSAGE
ncbi:hypothetical protein NDU88_000990 [Pleurodeles waltl]|uniref:Uncharacterized protein n=1 Tax=Pleurodeles waltl TaxID=8319 RepID=A0AAV7URJ9_PLEWA|nr:hypothetical protein NDU88_000990 [Pleurodeles waltl]